MKRANGRIYLVNVNCFNAFTIAAINYRLFELVSLRHLAYARIASRGLFNRPRIDGYKEILLFFNHDQVHPELETIRRNKRKKEGARDERRAVILTCEEDE